MINSRYIWVFIPTTVLITCIITSYRYVGIDFSSKLTYFAYCFEGENTCSPKYNVVYAKLAKTGSTTLQNILARKAFNENIFVGKPTQKRPLGATKHMVFHSMKQFNYKKISANVPNDTVYIGLLREPVSHFESTLYYFRNIVPAFRRANEEDLLRDYLENADKYFHGESDGERWNAGKNPLTYELGYDISNETDEYIQNTIKELDSRLDLVMMTEYYDISLLLLMELLCWKMEDIIYLPLNSRAKSKLQPVDPDLKEKVYKWNRTKKILRRIAIETQ